MQWRFVNTSGNKAVQLCRPLGKYPARFGLGGKGCEHTSPGSRHLRRPKTAQPINRILNLREAFFDQFLAVVFPALLKEGAYCNAD